MLSSWTTIQSIISCLCHTNTIVYSWDLPCPLDAMGRNRNSRDFNIWFKKFFLSIKNCRYRIFCIQIISSIPNNNLIFFVLLAAYIICISVAVEVDSFIFNPGTPEKYALNKTRQRGEGRKRKSNNSLWGLNSGISIIKRLKRKKKKSWKWLCN